MFRDTSPHHSAPNPSRAECDADEDAYWQDRAALMGALCYGQAEELIDLLDKRRADWRADDMPLLRRVNELLAEAVAISERLA